MELRSYLHDRHPISNAWRFVDALLFGQVTANAKAIKVHYDLEPEFFLSFLGETRCYTQGVFERPDEPLDVAIRRKFDYCLKECHIEPGTRMLDVGAGWGGWASYAAQRGVRVTGLTISEKSREFLTSRGKPAGVEWEIVKEDVLAYEPAEQFDSVVVMGVMEHLPNYPRVLTKLFELLKPGGYAFIDASAQRTKWEASSFIYRHVYPGNHSFFDLADFLTAVAKTPLRVRSVIDDRHSYYLTFMHWARNLESSRKRLVRSFGEGHFRRFQLYLWGAAHSFATDVLQCYRLVLEKPA
jgi:cyclopropane-fatty-acyl-phospholipid synthase